MSLPALLFAAFGVGFSGALIPGPLLTVNIAESARRGFWTGPIIIGGHAIAELFVVLALAVGFSTVLASEAAFTIIGILGGMSMCQVFSNRITSHSQSFPVEHGFDALLFL